MARLDKSKRYNQLAKIRAIRLIREIRVPNGFSVY